MYTVFCPENIFDHVETNEGAIRKVAFSTFTVSFPISLLIIRCTFYAYVAVNSKYGPYSQTMIKINAG